MDPLARRAPLPRPRPVGRAEGRQRRARRLLAGAAEDHRRHADRLRRQRRRRRRGGDGDGVVPAGAQRVLPVHDLLPDRAGGGDRADAGDLGGRGDPLGLDLRVHRVGLPGDRQHPHRPALHRPRPAGPVPPVRRRAGRADVEAAPALGPAEPDDRPADRRRAGGDRGDRGRAGDRRKRPAGDRDHHRRRRQLWKNRHRLRRRADRLAPGAGDAIAAERRRLSSPAALARVREGKLATDGAQMNTDQD